MATDGQIDQETIVRSLAELFADEEGVPLIEYASTLHQLSQRDDDSFRSSLEDSEGWNPVFADDNDNDQHIVFNNASFQTVDGFVEIRSGRAQDGNSISTSKRQEENAPKVVSSSTKSE